MHEKVSRPETLVGATYKIKTPLSDHALYLTINDIVLNPGTDHELRRPFEIFVNSKASIMMDGCMTCLNCGDSKCGRVE